MDGCENAEADHRLEKWAAQCAGRPSSVQEKVVRSTYQENLKRTWIWRGSMFCVETRDGKIEPKLPFASSGVWFTWSRPK
jgi:hypothetical protein